MKMRKLSPSVAAKAAPPAPAAATSVNDTYYDTRRRQDNQRGIEICDFHSPYTRLVSACGSVFMPQNTHNDKKETLLTVGQTRPVLRLRTPQFVVCIFLSLSLRHRRNLLKSPTAIHESFPIDGGANK